MVDTDSLTASDELPSRRPPGGSGTSPAFLVSFGILGIVGIVALVVAVLIGANNPESSESTAPVAVTLSELKINPGAIEASAAGGIHVTNSGSQEHNLAVKGTALKTAMIPAGGSAHLDLSSLKPGNYTVICQVPGHEQSGMTATLTVTGTQTGTDKAATGDPAMAGMDMPAASSGSPAPDSMTPAEMDAAMEKSIKAFPAETKGLGAQVLAPTVLADGTKQFKLVTEVTDWEVSPGKTVKAMTYNGTVPGPTLKVNPGDKVQVVLTNKMDESTSIHFHGLTTPNAMDGTTYVTQPPVKKGETFTYSFVAQSEPTVGMYHSHHDAVAQVPDGLAGAILVGEEPVPAGVTVSQETAMVLDDSGVIGYALNGKSFPATAPVAAKQGEWVEVHYMNEGTMIHPMHLHGMGQLVIAKDGFPVANPQMEDTVTVAPGERYTVLVHATEPGTWVWHCHILPHAENDQGMFGMVTALVVK